MSSEPHTDGAELVGRRRGTLAEDVAVHARQLILTGALRPGSKIDQDALGVALDVSRSPVREAVVILGQEGLLDVTPRRGASVAHLGPEDIIDHYELFGVVSGRAAAMAATALGDEQRDRLAAIHHQFTDAPVAELSELNEAFHRVINRAAPRRTRWLLRHLERSVPANYYEFAEGWNELAVEHHGEVLAAVLARDPDAARHAMERHLRASGVAAAESLSAQGFWSDA